MLVGVCPTARPPDPQVSCFSLSFFSGDQDYTGYDCSLRLCPKGDDPITGNGNGALDPLQVNEVQTVYCLANSGSFRLRKYHPHS